MIFAEKSSNMKVNLAILSLFTFFFYMTYAQFWQTNAGKHVNNFLRVYLTVFLALYLKGIIQNGQQEGQDFTLFNWLIIIPAAKWAFLAVLTNIYQLIALPAQKITQSLYRRVKSAR